MNKKQIQKKFNDFLNKQAKETEYECGIKDAFTRFEGWHDDYYEMLDFLYSLFDLEPDLIDATDIEN